MAREGGAGWLLQTLIGRVDEGGEGEGQGAAMATAVVLRGSPRRAPPSCGEEDASALGRAAAAELLGAAGAPSLTE